MSRLRGTIRLPSRARLTLAGLLCAGIVWTLMPTVFLPRETRLDRSEESHELQWRFPTRLVGPGFNWPHHDQVTRRWWKCESLARLVASLIALGLSAAAFSLWHRCEAATPGNRHPPAWARGLPAYALILFLAVAITPFIVSIPSWPGHWYWCSLGTAIPPFCHHSRFSWIFVPAKLGAFSALMTALVVPTGFSKSIVIRSLPFVPALLAVRVAFASRGQMHPLGLSLLVVFSVVCATIAVTNIPRRRDGA